MKFQSHHLINTTIFWTKLFDVLSKFALHCSFPVPHVQLTLLCCCVNQKRCLNKEKKIFISSKEFEIFEFFFLNRTTALLAVLLDRHDVITCISFAYKFKRMDANKIKMIDLIEICHPPDSYHCKCRFIE